MTGKRFLIKYFREFRGLLEDILALLAGVPTARFGARAKPERADFAGARRPVLIKGKVLCGNAALAEDLGIFNKAGARPLSVAVALRALLRPQRLQLHQRQVWQE